MDITLISDKIHSVSCASLAQELYKNGHSVKMILPLYESTYKKSKIKFNYLGNFNMNMPFGCVKIGLYHSYINSISCFFISNTFYFEHTKPSNLFNDAERISVFCYAALETLSYTKCFTEYIFTDSYRTALIPCLIKLKYKYYQGYENIKCFHYINENNYGTFNKVYAQSIFAIDEEGSHILLSANEVNLTKGAILCASRIFVGENGVSMLYDKNSSVHHPAVQFGFKIRKLRLGIDYSVFDSNKDFEIHKNYNATSISQKSKNKLVLQKHYGLTQDENIPLITLYPYKSRELITRIMKDLMRCDIQVIILYSESYIHRNYRNEHSAFPKKTVCETSFDLISLKNIFAGSDFAAFGGLYSPYGNPSFIASAYGCVPIIPSQRFFDCGISYFNKITLDGNGYTYDMHIPQDILYTLWDALGVYRHDKKTYGKLVQNCMKKDFSVAQAVKTIELETEKSPYNQY